MTPITLAAADLATRDPSNWGEDFVPFSRFHLVTVLACVAIMGGASVLGRLWRGTPREARFRQTWGVAVLLYQVYITIFWFLPSNLTWARSIPLMLCDLAAFLAGFAMLQPNRRWMLTILYFWGIGLSTQAFFTPIVAAGYDYGLYWRFWAGHVAIVGSAIYALVVLKYRPTARDLRLAILVTIGYAAVVTIVNLSIDRLGVLPPGERANYGYIGNSTPKNPTAIDKLGPWPGRVGLIAVIVISAFVGLWAVWKLPGLLRRKPSASGAGTN